ncbi:MAG: hypothetical protein JWN00_2499 [Actinomycetia bacterium]|jgi:hypothetical protein|nr:hypothetical protein [Actinomycetes bacterium]
MGLRLPGAVEWLLNEMNYIWPEVDEDKLAELGRHWLAYGGKLQTISGEAQSAAAEVWTGNHGPMVDAFKARWEHEKSPAAVLRDGATAAYAMGAVLELCAVVVLMLKIHVLMELYRLLVLIYEAIMLGPETGGGSLAFIALYKEISRRIVDLFFNMAIDAIL